MKVRIRRFDKDLPLPAYKTPGAVAMDCCARVDTTILPHEHGYIPLNIALKPPPGHFVMMAPRSSLHKRGLLVPNSIGIFDEDFSGNGDEYQAIVYNFTKEPVEIKRGERLTQIVFIPYHKAELEEVDELDDPTRGGIGSTGI